MELREKEWRATAATHYTSAALRASSPSRAVYHHPAPLHYGYPPRHWGHPLDYRLSGSPMRYGASPTRVESPDKNDSLAKKRDDQN